MKFLVDFCNRYIYWNFRRVFRRQTENTQIEF